LNQYGFDSILSTRLLQQLQTRVAPTVDMVKLQESRTIKDIIKILPPPAEGITAPVVTQQAMAPQGMARAQFPEILQLNRAFTGRPVFWLHGALGGVEAYLALAQTSQRPFYGIQARGWMTDRAPLHGLQAMVAYYLHIIQSIQPQGPYDLGGYSLGGVLAYEAARQLQELGYDVETLVMLDSQDSKHLKRTSFSQKSTLLQTVNIMLGAAVQPGPGQLPPLIHRDEINAETTDEGFLQQLITLAEKRGLTKNAAQVQQLVRKSIEVQQSYNQDQYDVLPLPKPQGVTCYYFRNKSGLFLGELEPFLSLTAAEYSLDHTHYWTEWEQHLPNLYIAEVEAPNHMMMLTEPKVQERIFAFCSRLYSEKGISPKDLKYFMKKTNAKPGEKKPPVAKKKATRKKKTTKQTKGGVK
jgi:polyketide synthase PksN